MQLIKLNAIDSTNSYLKLLLKNKNLETFTVVVANYQTKGRGQMGTSWVSDEGKNLTFSILIKFSELKIQHRFYLNMAISLGVYYAIKDKLNKPIAIKWPNDILAEGDKIAGILIENSLKGNLINYSIVGIGLNVNQTEFSKITQKATSLKIKTGTDFNLDELLIKLVTSIETYVGYVVKNEFNYLKNSYLNILYKFNKPAMFTNLSKTIFMGKIIDISQTGQLIIETETGDIQKYNLKEIKFSEK